MVQAMCRGNSANSRGVLLKGGRGFTLIEVLVSMVIFTICILFGMSFYIFSSQVRNRAENLSFAIRVAKSNMEIEKTRAYASLGTFSYSAEWDPDHVICASTTVTVGTEHTYANTGTTQQRCKPVSVTVGWMEKTTPRTIRFSTNISSSGVANGGF